MNTDGRWRISTSLRNGRHQCFETYRELREIAAVEAARLLPVSLAAHRDDIVQIAMLRLMNAVERSSEHGFSRAYIRRVVYSVSIDAWRRKSTSTEILLDPRDQDQVAGAIETPSRLDVLPSIAAALERLSPARREAVAEYLLGRTPKEIAELKGWSHKRAENLTFRGLADLRQRLGALGLQPDP